LFPENKNLLVELFTKSKLYYCLRLNFAEQIKSTHGINITGICDQRTNKSTMMITGADANRMTATLTNEIGIMGEWYKDFNGELKVLEAVSKTYDSNDFGRYLDTYSFIYDSPHTKQFVEQIVDVLEIFNRGNRSYSLNGD
jgi:hypothetical protein